MDTHLMEDLDTIDMALCGTRGADQRIIAEEGVKLVATLLKKNRDYGGSAWAKSSIVPGLSAMWRICVRIEDKIARIGSLLSKDSCEVNESLADTFRDLAGYGILAAAAPELREGDKDDQDACGLAERTCEPVGDGCCCDRGAGDYGITITEEVSHEPPTCE